MTALLMLALWASPIFSQTNTEVACFPGIVASSVCTGSITQFCESMLGIEVSHKLAIMSCNSVLPAKGFVPYIVQYV